MEEVLNRFEVTVIKYFNENPEVSKIPAKELMPFFITEGLFSKNHKDGLPIRKLLRKLDENGDLGKFPFIVAERKAVNINWYFVRPPNIPIGTFHLLHHPDIATVAADFRKTTIEKEKVKYNLYSLSNSQSHYENFHSDVIASLLDPKGLHNCGNVFLMKFLDYLNDHYDTRFGHNDFKNSVVRREEGKLDIFIRDMDSLQAIIIENKINNAHDMVNQIDRYHQYAAIKHGFKVIAIIYLTIDGLKQGPVNDLLLRPIVKNLGAFTDNASDLYNGWIIPCANVAHCIETKSLLIQYGKLIRHLANRHMDTATLQRFYDFINENNGLETVDTIVKLSARIPQYRADKFAQAIHKIEPFRKQFRYRPNYWLFENLPEGQNNYKIDVCFESNGSAWVVFWNPEKDDQAGWDALTEKLLKLNLLHLFNSTPTFGYRRDFMLSEKYPTMEIVDTQIAVFVNLLFSELSKAHDMQPQSIDVL